MNDSSILDLILDANWIVQLVMLGLVVASVVSWTYIFRYMGLLNKMEKADRFFDDQFWSGTDVSELYRYYQNRNDIEEHGGLARIFVNGFKEFSRLSKQTDIPDVVMTGVQRMMRVALSREQERLDQNLPFLGTLGSTAPYIGLFGTVIGVMNAFRGLGNAHQTTLAAVAPGIAEALIATAIGLIAAIPAVVAYNRFNSRIDKMIGNYEIFSEEFMSVLHRQIHRQKSIDG